MFDVRTIPGADKLNTAFTAAGFELRLVGGAVRDILLDITPKDFDFATDATPAEMKQVAERARFGCIATGEAHGTMTIVVDGEPFEVTTLRIDVETDGRRAEVEFTRSFEEDAARRDLTFNAMSMDFEGNLYDYFNGQLDLERRIVRFVGDPRQRVEEDYLRILRYMRFAARFTATATPNVIELFKQADIQAGLRTISVERYWLEMSKLLVAPHAYTTVCDMIYTGLLETIGLPVDEGFADFRFGDDAPSALSAFLNEENAVAFCRSWKLSRDVMDKVIFLVRQRKVDYTPEAVEDLLVDGTPRDWVVSWTRLNLEGVYAAETFDPPKFPVRGEDLMAQGMKPGPEMGQKLKAMREVWKNSRFQMTKDELLAEAP